MRIKLDENIAASADIGAISAGLNTAPPQQVQLLTQVLHIP